MAQDTSKQVVVPESPKLKLTVYQCIAAVAGEMAKEGIAKGHKNVDQNYRFRGIDDVYNALSPLLAKHGLVILPRVQGRTCDVRQTQRGSALYSVVVEVEFDFVSSHDGSTHCVKTFGEAMDTADKATNKAMSAAYKYAMFQTFAIPTEGDENDADKRTPEETVMPSPDGFAEWLVDLESVADEGREKLQDAWKRSSNAFRKYLVSTDMKRWDRIKDKAGRVSDHGESGTE